MRPSFTEQQEMMSIVREMDAYNYLFSPEEDLRLGMFKVMLFCVFTQDDCIYSDFSYPKDRSFPSKWKLNRSIIDMVLDICSNDMTFNTFLANDHERLVRLCSQIRMLPSIAYLIDKHSSERPTILSDRSTPPLFANELKLPRVHQEIERRKKTCRVFHMATQLQKQAWHNENETERKKQSLRIVIGKAIPLPQFSGHSHEASDSNSSTDSPRGSPRNHSKSTMGFGAFFSVKRKTVDDKDELLKELWKQFEEISKECVRHENTKTAEALNSKTLVLSAAINLLGEKPDCAQYYYAKKDEQYKTHWQKNHEHCKTETLIERVDDYVRKHPHMIRPVGVYHN